MRKVLSSVVTVMAIVLGLGLFTWLVYSIAVQFEDKPQPPGPPPPPARFQILGRIDYGTINDPSNYISVICDHQTGSIVYANARGGVTQYSGTQYTCPIIPESK